MYSRCRRLDEWTGKGGRTTVVGVIRVLKIQRLTKEKRKTK